MTKSEKIEAFKRAIIDYIDAVASEKAANYSAEDSCAGLSEAINTNKTYKELNGSIDDLFEYFDDDMFDGHN